MAETKLQFFERTSAKRLTSVLRQVEILQETIHRNDYEWSAEHRDKMFDALDVLRRSVREKFAEDTADTQTSFLDTLDDTQDDGAAQ